MIKRIWCKIFGCKHSALKCIGYEEDEFLAMAYKKYETIYFDKCPRCGAALRKDSDDT